MIATWLGIYSYEVCGVLDIQLADKSLFNIQTVA